MNLKEFIDVVKESPELSGSFVCTFQTREPSPLFFTQLFARLKALAPIYASFDAELLGLDEIQTSLEMSFLGQRLVYFVKNIHTLDEASKKSWEAFIKKYEGPHCIIYVKTNARASKTKSSQPTPQASEPESGFAAATGTSLAVPTHLTVALDQIDMPQYQMLAQFLYLDVQLDSHFMMQLFNYHESLSLDEACSMLAYHATVGRKYEQFFAQWLDRLIIPKKSFFTMSQHFFARKPRLFFEQWNLCKGEYPPEFWIAYWSAQLWEAMLYVQRARTQGMMEAKKGTYKLPFSFLNKDWSLYTPESLSAAHEALYRFDFNLKNGGTGNGLELWYHRFLTA